jgi:hypothetical protein
MKPAIIKPTKYKYFQNDESICLYRWNGKLIQFRLKYVVADVWDNNPAYLTDICSRCAVISEKEAKRRFPKCFKNNH